jgi:hypothetical protein
MDWGGAKFAVFVILELLIGAFIFRTIYDMTDYVVKSAEMESKILLNILRI